jgi:hypothetical protein
MHNFQHNNLHIIILIYILLNNHLRENLIDKKDKIIEQ